MLCYNRSWKKCSRNAVINGLCTQHYKKLEQELLSDITNNVLSEYMEFQELKELNKIFEGFTIDLNREKFYKSKPEKIRERKTYLDDILIKKEF
jgi:hypothetical protein